MTDGPCKVSPDDINFTPEPFVPTPEQKISWEEQERQYIVEAEKSAVEEWRREIFKTVLGAVLANDRTMKDMSEDLLLPFINQIVEAALVACPYKRK